MSLILKSLFSGINTINNGLINKTLIHTSAALSKNIYSNNHGPQKWLRYNNVIHPPQENVENPAVNTFLTNPSMKLLTQFPLPSVHLPHEDEHQVQP